MVCRCTSPERDLVELIEPGAFLVSVQDRKPVRHAAPSGGAVTASVRGFGNEWPSSTGAGATAEPKEGFFS